MDDQPHGSWYALLSPREQATIDHALNYARDYSHAGVPGHSAHLLIAKLATLLDEAKVQKMHWDDKEHCWRDVMTGVKVVQP